MNVETYKLQSNGFFSFTSLIVKIPKGHDWLLYKIGPSLEYAWDDSNIQLSFGTERKCGYICVLDNAPFLACKRQLTAALNKQ